MEPARGGYFDPRLAALTGDEREAMFHDGRWLPPPIHHLTGLTYEHSGPDGSLFTMPVTGWLMSPQGVLAGSAMFIAVDGALGSCLGYQLPPATPMTTSEISMSFVRPVTKIGDALNARAQVVHKSRTLALCATQVEDGDGNLVAFGGARQVIFPSVPLPENAAEIARAVPPLPRPPYDTPDPYLRPVRGEVLPQAVFDEKGGLEILRGIISGDLARPPIHYLCGVSVVGAGESGTVWTMPATEWLCSPTKGRLYGGFTAFLAGLAMEGAYMTIAPAGTAIAPVDAKVYFLRPVPPDGRDLTATGTIVHRGRTVCIATSEIIDADGKKVAYAIGSAMLLAGRPAALTRELEPAPEETDAGDGAEKAQQKQRE